ncbi:hypothetical protein B1813_19045 [Saccharomonospora piscinae]|uniref:Uncharacterized protein n=1 Tax=Saccharomonospora piscinae TaxID=687388 RepID=A0A1V8ZYR3_SACPI|nr:hypothetical protein [Saccharomonospora piscinae]OQO89938.1 hypothetical protein B1813_19045 [Saccharomonospora piscinae]
MGWGANPAGVEWDIDPALDEDFSVSLGRGRIANPAGGVFRVAYLPYDLLDVDLTVNVQTNQVATGSWINASVRAREAVGDYIAARVEYRDTGEVSLSLYEVNGGTAVLGTVILGTYEASDPLMLRVQVVGEYARAKAWERGAREPDIWQVGSPLSHVLAPGRAGLGAVLSAGNTNTNPEVSWGGLTIANPQQFTVVRSVNGVVKPHTPGSSVKLARPSVLAL